MTFKDLPLVSFVMSVHNSSNTVRKSIDSMLAQQYENMEILIMDEPFSRKGTTDLHPQKAPNKLTSKK